MAFRLNYCVDVIGMYLKVIINPHWTKWRQRHVLKLISSSYCLYSYANSVELLNMTIIILSSLPPMTIRNTFNLNYSAIRCPRWLLNPIHVWTDPVSLPRVKRQRKSIIMVYGLTYAED